MKNKLSKNESLSQINTSSEQIEKDDLVQSTKGKLDRTQQEVQNFVERHPGIDEIRLGLASCLPDGVDTLIIKDLGAVTMEDVYAITPETLGDWVDILDMDELILAEDAPYIIEHLQLFLGGYFAFYPSAGERSISSISDLQTQIDERAAFFDLFGEISSGLVEGNVDVKKIQENPTQYWQAFALALDDSNGAAIDGWTQESPIIIYLEEQYSSFALDDENDKYPIALSLYQYIQKVRLAPILDPKTSLIGREYLDLFGEKVLRASSIDGSPAVEEGLISWIENTEFGSEILDMSIQTYMSEEAKGVYGPLQEANMIMQLTESDLSLQRGGTHDIAKKLDSLDQGYDLHDLDSVRRHDVIMHSLGKDIIGLSERIGKEEYDSQIEEIATLLESTTDEAKKSELQQQLNELKKNGIHQSLDVSGIQHAIDDFTNSYNLFLESQANRKKLDTIRRIPMLLEADRNNQSLPMISMFGTQKIGSYTIRDSEGRATWKLEKEDIGKPISLTAKERQKIQKTLDSNKKSLLGEWKKTLSPLSQKITEEVRSKEQLFNFIGDNHLVEKAFINGGSLPSVAAQELVDAFIGKDETERGKLSRTYTLQMVEGLKEMFPTGPITLTIMKRLFSHFPDEVWELATEDGGGIVSNIDPLQMLSPIGLIAGAPTYLDFSKYPGGEVVVPNHSGAARMVHNIKQGKVGGFLKELASVGLSAFAVGKGFNLALKIPKIKKMHNAYTKFREIGRLANIAGGVGKVAVKGSAFHVLQKLSRTGLDGVDMMQGETTFMESLKTHVGMITKDQFGNTIHRDAKHVAIENAVAIASGGFLFTNTWSRWGKRNFGGASGGSKELTKKVAALHTKLIETGGTRGSVKSVMTEAGLFTVFHGVAVHPVQEGLIHAVNSGDENALLAGFRGLRESMGETMTLKELFRNAVFIGALRMQHTGVSKTASAVTSKMNPSLKVKYFAKEKAFNKALEKKGIEKKSVGEEILLFKDGKQIDLKTSFPELHTLKVELGTIQAEILYIVQTIETVKAREGTSIEQSFKETYGLTKPRMRTEKQIDVNLEAAKKSKNQEEIQKREDIKAEREGGARPYVQVSRIQQVREKMGWKDSWIIKNPEAAIKNSQLGEKAWRKEMKKQFEEQFGIEPPHKEVMGELRTIHQNGVLYGNTAQRNTQTAAMKKLVKEGKLTKEQSQLLMDWGYCGIMPRPVKDFINKRLITRKHQVAKDGINEIRGKDLVGGINNKLTKDVIDLTSLKDMTNFELSSLRNNQLAYKATMRQLREKVDILSSKDALNNSQKDNLIAYKNEIKEIENLLHRDGIYKGFERVETGSSTRWVKKNYYGLEGKIKKLENDYLKYDHEIKNLSHQINENNVRLKNFEDIVSKEKDRNFWAKLGIKLTEIKAIEPKGGRGKINILKNQPTFEMSFRGKKFEVEHQVGARLLPVLRWLALPQGGGFGAMYKQMLMRTMIVGNTIGYAGDESLYGKVYDRRFVEPTRFVLDLLWSVLGRPSQDETTGESNLFYSIYSAINPQRDWKPRLIIPAKIFDYGYEGIGSQLGNEGVSGTKAHLEKSTSLISIETQLFMAKYFYDELSFSGGEYVADKRWGKLIVEAINGVKPTQEQVITSLEKKRDEYLKEHNKNVNNITHNNEGYQNPLIKFFYDNSETFDTSSIDLDDAKDKKMSDPKSGGSGGGSTSAGGTGGKVKKKAGEMLDEAGKILSEPTVIDKRKEEAKKRRGKRD